MGKRNGLYEQLLDMDKFIRINQLRECTNPIFIDRRIPTPDGVLSYEIFGTSQEERKSRMAYIDLHGHYMHPLAAVKLASYDRTMSKVLMSQGRWRLDKDTLVEDPENGDSGPEFLYSIWGKVKPKKSKDTSDISEEELSHAKEAINEFYQQDRDKLFITKFLVIPAFYRDINAQSADASKKSTNVLNSYYSSLIAYTQSLNMYTDSFTNMSRLTRARVQNILNSIYQTLAIEKVKGQPSKFGMLRRSLQGKNINYSARLVITAPILMRQSYQDVQVKYGYACLPLAYALSCFMPFMIHELKSFYDREFIQGGKLPVINSENKLEYRTFSGSYEVNDITEMIVRYIKSPGNRFDLAKTPPDVDGKQYGMTLTGRFNRAEANTTIPATITDIMYLVAHRALRDKHILITRYPLDNYNGQFPAKIEITTTVRTQPAIIGDELYQFFPISKGDPLNAFVDTMQFSNTYLGPLGGDSTQIDVMVPAAVML